MMLLATEIDFGETSNKQCDANISISEICEPPSDEKIEATLSAVEGSLVVKKKKMSDFKLICRVLVASS
jgi:hypothetical protein